MLKITMTGNYTSSDNVNRKTFFCTKKKIKKNASTVDINHLCYVCKLIRKISGIICSKEIKLLFVFYICV